MALGKQIRRVARVVALASPFLAAKCCRAFIFVIPPSPHAATRKPTLSSPWQARQQQQIRHVPSPTKSSLAAFDQPIVDLILQHHHQFSVLESCLTSSHFLLGTDVTLHHMASVMDPDSTTTTITTMSPSTSSPAAPLSPATTVAVFVAGIVPFAVATVEFWRRIAVGLPFGTGSKEDSVVIVIGDDNNRQLSRGRRVLGNDAVVVAILLFAVAAAVLGVTVASVLTSAPPPPAGGYS